MRISKEKAVAAAEKIAAPLKQKIADYEKEMSKKVLAEYMAEIPKDVLTCFKKNPSFFKTENSVHIGYFKSNYVYARFGHAIPAICDFRTDERKRGFVKYINDLETLHENYDNAVRTISNTILALGTIKRVESDFPEAAPYIDIPSTIKTVAVNVAPVRKLACGLIPNCKSGTKKP